MSKKSSNSKSINPNKLKTRDINILKVIGGATKAGVYKDLKKEENKKRARARVKNED